MKAKTKRSPKASKGVAQLKKIADKEFSRYVRLRDSDSTGHGNCITCGVRVHWKSAHAGHFVKRSVSLLRYDEENVNLQCAQDNIYKYGEQYAYAKALDEKYGDGTADKLHAQRFTTHKFTTTELETIIEDCRAQIKWMEKHESN